MVRSIFILTLLILSCSRKDDKSNDSLTQSDSVTVVGQKDKKGKCNSILDNKVYQYRYDSEMSDDYLFTLIFKCEQKGLDGKIFGPDPEGEHGLWFFRADLENLKVDSLSNIEFEFSQGYLYPDRITMDNYLDSLNTDNAGFSRGQIYYKGKISGDSIVFKCNPEYDCYDEVMTFRVKN